MATAINDRIERRQKAAAHLSSELDRAAAILPANRVRDVVCDWLAAKGLWRGESSEQRFDFLDYDAPYALDGLALRRAADLAHRDPGHIGRLDMCEAELCRALGEAGAA